MPTDSKSDLPGTIQRSSKKAQRTYKKTLENAHDEYDSEERAHRTAYSALKHSFEKVGDHWEEKDEKGPSDEHAKGGRDNGKETAGGVAPPASPNSIGGAGMTRATRSSCSGPVPMWKSAPMGWAISSAKNRPTLRPSTRRTTSPTR